MARTIAPIEERRTAGIGIMLFAQLFFTVLDTSAKYLAVSGMPTAQIVFVRYAVHVVLAIAIFWPIQRDLFRTNSWRLELLRGLTLLGVTVTNFFAMRFLPLTVTGAILFTSPLMVVALSVPLLGEKVGWRRWIAVGAGFIGTLIIIRPGTDAFHPASLVALCGALLAAFYTILTRKLAGVDSPATQQVYSGLIAVVCIAPFAFTGWVWPTEGGAWFAFAVIGLVGMLAHQFNSISLRLAAPSVLAPFSYFELILVAIASWLIFSEPPDMWFYLGAPFIIGSGLFIWLRERRQGAATAITEVVD